MHLRRTEIDLIALDGDTLVFVEVRSRRGQTFGTALESLTRTKRRRMLRGARTYLANGPDRPFRIDLVAVQVGRDGAVPLDVEHLKSVVEG